MKQLKIMDDQVEWLEREAEFRRRDDGTMVRWCDVARELIEQGIARQTKKDALGHKRKDKGI
jgi:hypothetical protein